MDAGFFFSWRGLTSQTCSTCHGMAPFLWVLYEQEDKAGSDVIKKKGHKVVPLRSHSYRAYLCIGEFIVQ